MDRLMYAIVCSRRSTKSKYLECENRIEVCEWLGHKGPQRFTLLYVITVL
jgi:hypothetical protein